MSAHLESVAAASRDAHPPDSATVAHSAAAAAAAPGLAATACSVAPTAVHPNVLPAHELAAVKQRIAEMEQEIAQVVKQLDAAASKRDSVADDDPKWARFDADVQRLGRKEDRLRDEKALLLKKEEQLRDELKRKELALERERQCTLPSAGGWHSTSAKCVLSLWL